MHRKITFHVFSIIRFIFYVSLVLGILILNFSILFSQTKHFTNLSLFGVDQNLSSANVRKIIKDKNNFLWLSTQDGLNKFEGNNITQFTKGNINPKRQLIGIDCFALEYKEGDDLLYLLTSYEGLNIINITTNEVVAAIPAAQLIGSKESVYFNRMVRAGDHLFISTDKGRIVRFNVVSRKVDSYTRIHMASGELITDLYVHNNLLSIILSNAGILYYDPETFKLKWTIRLPIALKGVERSVTINILNETWIATDRGIIVVDTNDGTLVDVKNKYPWFPANLLTLYTTAIYESKNDLYISNINGTYVFNLTTGFCSELLDIRSDEGNNFLKSANSILRTDNQLWIGGTSGMAQINIPSASFKSCYKQYNNSNLKVEHTYGMRTDNLKQVLVGCDDGVYLANSKDNLLRKVIDNESCFSMEQLNDESHLMSGSKDLWLYDKGIPKKAATVYPELKPIQNDVFISMERFGADKLLLASQLQTGLFLWDMRRHTIQLFNSVSQIPIIDLLINRVLVCSDDSVFVVSESVIQMINFNSGTTVNVFERQNLKQENAGFFMDMCKQGNNYYIAGYGIGIIKLNEKFEFQKILSIKEGINNIGLFKIFSVGDSLIVATSNNGLVVYHTKQDKIRNYYKEDGLHSNSFEEASGYQQGDSIYIGGLKGFTIFNTKNYRTNDTPPQLYFNTLSYETPTGTKDTTNLFIKYFKVPNNVTQTKISFTGLNYLNPHRVQYAYRIKELNDLWTDLKTQNFVPLIGISPGTYTLEVKSANEDGVECVPISMTLHFQPKWYQTWLFKMAVVLAIAGLLYALYSFRIKQLKRIIFVRQKISSDLHDDIGSTLSTINMYSQVAQLHGPGNVPIMHNIQANAQEVLEKLDDIVWATNPKNDQVKNLVERIDAYARPLLQAKEIQFIFNIDEHISNHKIGEGTRQNLFLICKEAINNAVKYAECKTCTVSLYKKGNHIYCSITDDGIGFDISVSTERNGLLNMKLRAAAVKGKLEIMSSIGNGTSIQVVMPL